MKTNIEIVQQAYAEFGKGNIPGIIDLLDDNIIWEFPETAQVPFAGIFKGKTGVMDFFKNVAATEDFQEFNVEKILGDDTTVIALGNLKAIAKNTGKTSANHWAMRWEFANGKVVKYYHYADSAEIYNAFH